MIETFTSQAVDKVGAIRPIKTPAIKVRNSDRHDSRDWRKRVKPTTSDDISPPARLYIKLVESAIEHQLAIITLGVDAEDAALRTKHQDALNAVRQEVNERFVSIDLFEAVVQSRMSNNTK